MSNLTNPNDHKDLSFLFKSVDRLAALETQKKADTIISVSKKWVAAAMIALASGSTVLLTSNTVNAATSDANSEVQVTAQNQNTTENKTQAGDTANNHDTEQNVTVQANSSQQSNQETNTTDQNNTPENNNQVQAPANQADHVKGNVQSAWDQGYKGQGTVVAVIDSGADPSHKDFQTMPESPKLSKDDVQKKIEQQGYGKYVNEKFPYVYNYADRDNDYVTSDDTNSNDSPHGQHVSGIIAADGKPDGNKEYVVGVAPEAQLMQLRVFGQFSDEKTDDIAKAIYDATNLGEDVIQMSLGQGVADQQLTNIEQKAVQYAIDHGVFVSISASNNGHSGSVDNTSNVTSVESYESGSADGNYELLNSSTVANPGASKNALTVAAETSATGKDSDMAGFSSWGPVQDFTLKPDLAAPGYQVVSTVNNNNYQTMSGTSMAGPFAAASAALVMQRLKKTNPELKGAQLVAATKALLMNSAKPQTQNGYTTPVSPRRQGAGQIDVGAATSNPVYVITDDGTSSVLLHQVKENTPFTLTFHNLSDQEQVYTFDDFGGGYTEQRDSNTAVYHDVQLAGARVYGEHSFSLAPKETKQVTYSLTLNGLNNNQLVEVFLRFTNTNDKSTVSVPYLAYYGDLTSENVFDQNANEEHPDIQGNQFVNEQNYPRGVADQESLKQLVNVEGDYNWQEVAKDGNYTYRLVATLWNEGPHQVQTADFPVVIDTVAPTLSNVKYDEATNTLSGEYQDTGAGFINYSYATVTVNDKVFGYKLSDSQSAFDNAEKTKGHFSFALDKNAVAALSNAENKVSVALSDVADNTAVYSVDVAGKDINEPAVSVWNATNGLAFDQNSTSYNNDTKTYTLIGGANQDFYLNGKLVQVQNGQYSVPVDVNSTNLVFSTDATGKNVLKNFSTVTPKAFFNWQVTDTFAGNFGVSINSVETNRKDDVVVQAAVPKGENVQAFAKDYFTGELYTGEVNDGVATFHVHTSINGGRRALLTGWTVVNGPSYNDKQETSQRGVASSNHLGVYYEVDAADRPVYTNRNQLGVEVKDEAANVDAFGPGAYPGHASSDLTTRTAPNPNIHFDYMNDNDTTRFGQNAVLKGYYDPTTMKFTVTGNVDDNVTSLTVLSDSSNENDPANQVKLDQNGKFSFAVTANSTGQRPIAYLYRTKDGQTVRGTLNLILDTVKPTLEVNQVNGNELELWTNNPKFVLSGKVNDNLDGYRLYVNGNNIYREFLNSGYNRLEGLNTDTELTNPYGDHEFEQVENLNDNNDQPTTHIFTVNVVDQAGNTVTKKLTVHFDPNYVVPTDNTDVVVDTSTSDTDGVTETKPIDPLVGKSFKLLHNAYLYDQNGEVVLTDVENAKSLLKKGQTIVALDNAKVTFINGVKFYRVGNNTFVKTANTVLQAPKRLKLTHNAYVYDQKGNVVKKHGKKVLLKKNQWISALNNADKYVIKGRLYYKLADGQFVKVANTVTKKAKLRKTVVS